MLKLISIKKKIMANAITLGRMPLLFIYIALLHLRNPVIIFWLKKLLAWKTYPWFSLSNKTSK